MSLLIRWLLSFLELLLLIYLLPLLCIYLIMAYLSIIFPWPGEVGLTEYVCTHVFVVVFLAADPDFDPEDYE
jgi:hypothetical protein